MPTLNPGGHGPNETRIETLFRLWQKAVNEQLEPMAWMEYDEESDTCEVVYSVTSRRVPNTDYYITPQSLNHGCTCQGWYKFGYCKHYALISGILGFFPPSMGAPLDPRDIDPEPDPEPAAAAVPGCWGCGAECGLGADGLCDACAEAAAVAASPYLENPPSVDEARAKVWASREGATREKLQQIASRRRTRRATTA